MTRVVRLELSKLLAQNRVRAVIGVCLLAPFVFAIAITGQQSLPKDTLFGRHLRESGFATPLVVLGFAGTWGFPLLTSLVAGDIFASEDHHRTWSLLLTRSVRRGQLFAGKLVISALFAIAVVLSLTVSSLAAGLLVVGDQPLVGLDGSSLGAGRCAGLVIAAWACALPPMLAFTAIALFVSTATRSSAAGIAAPAVAGLAMLLLSFINGPGWLHALLLPTGFDAWHGLLRSSPYLGPFLQSLAVSVGWAVVFAAGAWLVFRRRDFSRA